MKREREKHITRLHIILFGLVIAIGIIVLISIKGSGNKKIERYKKLERDLKTATIYYYGNNGITVPEGEMKKITMKTIVENGYLQDDITNECEGYTLISNFRNVDGEFEIEFGSYIKCGDSYKSDGFEVE